MGGAESQRFCHSLSKAKLIISNKNPDIGTYMFNKPNSALSPQPVN